MLDFVKRAFRNFFEVLLWINLIVCAIASAVIGGMIGEGAEAFLGLIIGVIVGIMTNIVGGGVIATLIAIEENTAKTAINITKTERNTAETLLANSGGGSVVGTTEGANCDSGSNNHTVDEQGRIDYRTWWGPDGGKYESWVDADGKRHENSYVPSLVSKDGGK